MASHRTHKVGGLHLRAECVGWGLRGLGCSQGERKVGVVGELHSLLFLIFASAPRTALFVGGAEEAGRHCKTIIYHEQTTTYREHSQQTVFPLRGA